VNSFFEFIALFFLFYCWHALGVTVGYHRLISHRSFSCHKLVEYFWVLPGYLAFEGSPIWWATIHRAHHRYTDTPLDPHSPLYGKMNAFGGWLTKTGYPSHIDPIKQCADLTKDPVYRFLEQGGDWHRAHLLVAAIGTAFRLLLLLAFGWVTALASLLAALAVLQIPLMLNVVCHIRRLGYQSYDTKDASVNVWWVALLAAGEGWHNNHHASPASAKTGMRFWEVDVSWMIISTLRFLGLAKNVRSTTHERLQRKFQSRVVNVPPNIPELSAYDKSAS
jgi:stearoyl-CoA desaturase (delta-9 desaturase)